MDTFVPILHPPAALVRRFIVVGGRAKSSADFKLHALGDSGGRMDILVRCIRAAMLVADGVRRDTQLDLLLLGGDDAPLALRLDGATIRFLRPDERRNARLLQRALAARHPGVDAEHVAPGMMAARRDLEALSREAMQTDLFVLDREGEDLRTARWGGQRATFVLGDDLGLSQSHREVLARCGARRLSLGPAEVHTEDAITIVHNELDRRATATG